MKPLYVLSVLLIVAAGAHAAITYSFEPPSYSGSAAGTSINGQNGWFTPAGSSDGNVYTYTSNALGFPTDPNGGTQFLGVSQANPDPGTASPGDRARQSLDLSSSSVWTFGYDFIVANNGNPEANNGNFANFGAIPILDSGTGSSGILLNQAITWNSDLTTFKVFDSGDDSNNNPIFMNPGGPSSLFNTLTADHWYHVTVTLNLSENQVTQETIADLTAGSGTTTYAISNFFLDGGSLNTFTATTFGLTVVGDLDNNGTNFAGLDNVSFTPGGISAAPEPSTMAMLGCGLAALMFGSRRLRRKS